MTYQEQLLDPRWQKKRLQIFERDSFCCRSCSSSDKTLMVHHLMYGLMAWEADDEHLITLCGDCHKEFHESMPLIFNEIIKSLKSTFNNPYYAWMASTVFRSFKNLNDLMFLLSILDEEDVISILRKKFQNRIKTSNAKN